MRRWSLVAAIGVLALLTGVGVLGSRSGSKRAGTGRAPGVTATATATATSGPVASPSPSPTLTASPVAAASPGPVATASPAAVVAWSGPSLACGSLPISFASPPPVGTPLSTTAALGTVTARLSGQAAPFYGAPGLASAHLTITESGAQILSAAVAPPKDIGGRPTSTVMPWDIGPLVGTAQPGASDTAIQALCVAHFAGEALPTVLLGLDLGGAHCCTVVRAYGLVPGGARAPVDDNLGNPGASLQAQGDHAILVTADNAFAYQFDSFAGSGMPVLALEFSGGSFVNTTRRHLDLVQADAARFWGFVNDPSTVHDGVLGLGLLSPWVADECLLGHEAQAWATIDAFQSQGKLGTSSPGPGGGWPTGEAYISALHTFLRQHHYCS